MTNVKDTPEFLKPYVSHGLELNFNTGDKDALGDCPWCGREGRFSVTVKTGVWHCFKCDEKGNATVFVRKLHEESLAATTDQDYAAFAKERSLLFGGTMRKWNLAKSILNGNWLIPGYAVDGSIKNVYQYIQLGDRKLLLPTATLKHYLFGMNLYGKSRSTVYLCESVWDGMALWEVMSRTKNTGAAYKVTANTASSLLADASVIAIPSCTVFAPKWTTLFGGKRAVLMAQNDHSRKHPKTGENIPSASYAGMQRICSMLNAAKKTPTDIDLLYWGEEGHNPDLKSGYDLRDRLNEKPKR